MTSWEDIATHLRSRYKLQKDEPAALAFSCRVPVGDREFTQGIGLAPTRVHNKDWLAIVADLFPEQSLESRSALLYQDRFAFGAIVIRNDVYLLRHGVALDSLSLADLDWNLTMTAFEAVRLRANLRGAPPSHDAFGNYAE